MKPILLTPEAEAIARRVVWFEQSAAGLEAPIRFTTYAMKHVMHEGMEALRHQVSDDNFREALDKAPPGIIDLHSWPSWNSAMGRHPPPPLPKRTFA